MAPPRETAFDLVRLFDFAMESPLSPDLPPRNPHATKTKRSRRQIGGEGWGEGVACGVTLGRSSPPHPIPSPKLLL
jgi:hypothetical protein